MKYDFNSMTSAWHTAMMPPPECGLGSELPRMEIKVSNPKA